MKNPLSMQKTAIVLNLGENLPQVHADASRMQQVLVNLLVNAGDAMAEERVERSP